MGRKSTYSIDIAHKICDLIADGEPLHKICKENDWAPTDWCVYSWVDKYEEFAKMYARARERQQEKYAAEVILIADTETDVAKARNMMDARKWYASKVAPKRWGDKLEVEAKVEVSNVPSENLTAFLAAVEKAKQGG